MSRLRRMLLRRKTDPKTGKHKLCEPAQAKCTWTEYNNHFVRKFTGKTTGDTSGDIVLCELRSRNAHGHVTKTILYVNLQGKCRTRIPRHPFLCELAQSKRTWTCHNRHFVRKFTGKKPDASDTTSIEHRALTPTVRTPQCGHTVLGKTLISTIFSHITILKRNFMPLGMAGHGLKHKKNTRFRAAAHGVAGWGHSNWHLACPPSGNQPWLTGKSLIVGGLMGQIIYKFKNGGFSIAMLPQGKP